MKAKEITETISKFIREDVDKSLPWLVYVTYKRNQLYKELWNTYRDESDAKETAQRRNSMRSRGEKDSNLNYVATKSTPDLLKLKIFRGTV